MSNPANNGESFVSFGETIANTVGSRSELLLWFDPVTTDPASAGEITEVVPKVLYKINAVIIRRLLFGCS